MANPPNEPWDPTIFPYMLVSVGTGRPSGHSRFGAISILKWILTNIMDTLMAHRSAGALVAQCPHVPSTPVNSGLSHIRMDRCQKRRKRKGVSATNVDQTISENDRSATEREKGGYKPHKYEYKTFDQIRERTLAYLDSQEDDNHSVSDRIDCCARELRNRHLGRRKVPSGRERWDLFRKHPNPRYNMWQFHKLQLLIKWVPTLINILYKFELELAGIQGKRKKYNLRLCFVKRCSNPITLQVH
jgi:hypothetical protein